MRYYVWFGVFVLSVFSATIVNASDMNIGSTARSAAIGGAGLALGDDAPSNSVINPAAPAVSGTKFRFIFPGVDFHSTGASYGDLMDNIDKIGKGSDVNQLVNDFGKQETSFTVSSVVGVAGTFGFALNGEASAIISPGEAAREWVSAAQNFTNGNFVFSDLNGIKNSNFQSLVSNANAGNLSASEAAFNAYLGDLSKNYVSAAFSYGPSISLSSGVPTSKGKLWVGANFNILKVESKRWQVTSSSDPSDPFTISGLSPSSPVKAIGDPTISAGILFDSVEMPTESKTSLKVDFGAIYKPEDSMLQYGLVVNNAIKPRVSGIRYASADPIISVGVAAKPVYGLTVAADLVNLTKSNNQKTDLRMGAEWKLGRMFAARAGYTGKNLTYGFELFGFDIAFAKSTPRMLSHLFRF